MITLIHLSLSAVLLAAPQAAPQAAPKDIRPAGVWYGAEKLPAKRAGALRIATYNAENLFDATDDPTLQGEFDDLNMATSEARLTALATMIHRLDADVLCLEEIESEQALRWFRDKYLSDMGYEHIASLDAGYYRGVEQSVLSRRPITAALVYSGDEAIIKDMEPMRTAERAATLGSEWATADSKTTERFQRYPLRVDIDCGGGFKLTMLVVHLKAGAFDHQRELEALQLEQFIAGMLAAEPNANIAVVGDFNATPGDTAAKVLRQSPLGLANAYDWRFNPAAPRETFITHASGRALDYIIMSPGLAADCIDESFFVMGTLHADSSWDYKKADQIPPPVGYASDHCPVAIDVDVAQDRPAAAMKKPAAVPALPVVAPAAPTAPTAPTPPTAPTAPVPPATQTSPPAARALSTTPASAADMELARALLAAGWTYIMPEPKSKTAKWENSDTRSTWYAGYWKNSATGATCAAQPQESKHFAAEGEAVVLGKNGKPPWAKGGAPRAPTIVEWLCSQSGGIEPGVGG